MRFLAKFNFFLKKFSTIVCAEIGFQKIRRHQVRWITRVPVQAVCVKQWRFSVMQRDRLRMENGRKLLTTDLGTLFISKKPIWHTEPVSILANLSFLIPRMNEPVNEFHVRAVYFFPSFFFCGLPPQGSPEKSMWMPLLFETSWTHLKKLLWNHSTRIKAWISRGWSGFLSTKLIYQRRGKKNWNEDS